MPRLQNIILHASSPCRHVVLGGENFPSSTLLAECWPADTKTMLHNIYGTTELSCWATMHSLRRREFHAVDRVPIGDSLSQTELQIRDDDGHVLRHGIGELYLGSSSRLCFLNQETEATHWRATADLVEISQTDPLNVYWVSRKGHVVKRNGQMLNLESVATQAHTILGATNCYCTLLAALNELDPPRLLCFALMERSTSQEGLAVGNFYLKTYFCSRGAQFACTCVASPLRAQ